MLTGTKENRLLAAIESGRAPHAILITGCDRAAAVLLARRAAALHCLGSYDLNRLKSCGDYFELGETPLKVAELRSLLAELAKRPVGGGNRAVLLRDLGGDKVDAACQHKLLKTLEEPPDGTLFLFTGSLHLIFPTVRSRCSVYHAPQPTEREIVEALIEQGAPGSEAENAAKLSAGSLERAQKLCFREGYAALRASALDTFLQAVEGRLPFSDSKKHKEDKTALDAVDYMLSFARDMLLIKETGRAAENPDLFEVLRAATKNFTTARINAIIETLAGARRRLNAHTPPASALDWLFIELSEGRSRSAASGR
ncbi:MAG: hypothetical protein ABFC62_06065 [Clostridiaceae bacterium]|nr:hypothetical protein [Eubacteriales bacterium]